MLASTVLVLFRNANIFGYLLARNEDTRDDEVRGRLEQAGLNVCVTKGKWIHRLLTKGEIQRGA